jgi:transposase
VTDRQILDAYRRSKSSHAVARRLEVSKTTVLRVVHDHEEGRGPRSTVYTPATLRKMAQARRAGANAVALAARYGGSVVTVLTVLRRAGVTHRVRQYLRRRTPAEVRRVLALRRAGLSYQQIADRMGRSRKLVQNVLRDNPPG